MVDETRGREEDREAEKAEVKIVHNNKQHTEVGTPPPHNLVILTTP